MRTTPLLRRFVARNTILLQFIDIMKALIFAAGMGKRMQPLTFEKPKPLLEVAGKPLLTRIFEILPEEISEIILVIGYKGEMIKSYFGGEWQGKKITYIPQEEPLGTAHALQLCREHLEEGERFLLLFADDLYDRESLRRLLRHERAILVSEVPNPERFGIIVADENGAITDFEEKPRHPKSNLASTGAYLLDTAIFDYESELHESGEYFLPPMLVKMMKDHDVHIERASLWIPIGYPEDLKKAEKILSS